MVCSGGLNTDSHVSKRAERIACYLPRWVRSRRRGGAGSPGAPFVLEVCHAGRMLPWGRAVAPLRGSSSSGWGLRGETQAETET